MLNYIKSECYRVMHSRSTYVMTGIMAVLPVLFHIILYVTGVASSTTQDFPYDITSFSFSFLAGSPMLFTYAGLIVAAGIQKVQAFWKRQGHNGLCLLCHCF